MDGKRVVAGTIMLLVSVAILAITGHVSASAPLFGLAVAPILVAAVAKLLAAFGGSPA